MRKERMRKGHRECRWLHGTAASRGGMGDAHSAGPFNKHAELGHDQDPLRERAHVLLTGAARDAKSGLYHIPISIGM